MFCVPTEFSDLFSIEHRLLAVALSIIRQDILNTYHARKLNNRKFVLRAYSITVTMAFICNH